MHMIFVSLFLTIIILFMALLNIYRRKFSYVEIVTGIVATYAVTLSLVFMSFALNSALDGDMFANIIITLCLTVFVYRKTKDILQSGYYALLAVILGMIANTVAGMPLLVIFSTNVDGVRDSLMLNIIMVTATIPLCYKLSKYVGNLLHNTYITLSQEIQKKFIFYGFTLSISTYLLSQINVFAYRIAENRVLLSSINIIVVTFIFFVALLITMAYSTSQQKQMEAEYRNKALKDLEGYVQHLGQAYDEMRNFRHDHLNILHGLMGFANGKNQADLKNHLMETMAYAKGSLEKLDNSMDKLKFIHIPALRGLLSVKFAHALEQGINVEIDIIKPVDDIPINHLDLCRMVGIMVDNAIEELFQGAYDTKVLKFGILLDDDDILIICSNTCKTPPPAEKIFRKDYSSKGYGRGTGLYSLKKTCEKCGNVLVTPDIKADEFSLILTVIR